MIVYRFRFDEFLIATHQVTGYTVYTFIMQFGMLKWRELSIGADIATHCKKISQSIVDALSIFRIDSFVVYSFEIRIQKINIFKCDYPS